MPAAVSTWSWSLDPALALIVAGAVLYRVGDRRTATAPRERAAARARSASFYAALVVLVVALDSPLEQLSRQLFWAHMVQHVLLLMVVAPLIVLARPWMRLWRCLPLGTRRSLGRGLSTGPRAAPLRAAGRALGRPALSFMLFAGVLLAWHVPALFDATLHSEALHALEHGLFLGTALLFWKQVIPSPPLHATLPAPLRVVYVIAAMIVSWGLAVVLAVAPQPLYDAYAHQAVRPGGISALADQQLAAGIMWVPGSITFVIVIFAYVHRWLSPPAPSRGTRLAGEH
jgi:cytochrome c oxidase assembly factor CtaG